jgi:diguanylate cyclase (GGDEF)-like protein
MSSQKPFEDVLKATIDSCMKSVKSDWATFIYLSDNFRFKDVLKFPKNRKKLNNYNQITGFFASAFEDLNSFPSVRLIELSQQIQAVFGIRDIAGKNGPKKAIIACFKNDSERSAGLLIVLIDNIIGIDKQSIQTIDKYSLIIDRILQINTPSINGKTFVENRSKSQKNNVSAQLEQKKQLDIEHVKIAPKMTDLKSLAEMDPLTGIYQRSSLRERFSQLIDVAKAKNKKLGCILLNIEHFRNINDTLGYEAGDYLINSVAERLLKVTRTEDVVGRLSGDEFVIILNDTKELSKTLNFIDRLLKEIEKPINIKNDSVEVVCRFGLSEYPKDGKTSECLLKFADSLMSQVRKNSAEGIQSYSDALRLKAGKNIAMKEELKHAIDANEFVLNYQPQMDMKTGRLVGMEALIRWIHPVRGLIPPDEFIPIAEELELISLIGDWVIRSVAAQLAQWKKQKLNIVPISINMSVKQLQHVEIVEYLRNIIHETGVDPKYMTLEITESLYIGSGGKYIKLLNEIKKMGFLFSIDDFGTGYSNLNYLKNLPVEEIKIDKCFVDNVVTSSNDLAIVKTIIAIAHNLGFKVVAEGIEKKSQVAILAKNKCDILQGYYFSRPKPAEECLVYLNGDTKLDLTGIQPEGYHRTILLVDDEENVLASLKRLLKPLSLNILLANDADEALEIMALNEVGVVLSDLNMPGIDGIELLSRVHKIHPYAVRMVLSGNSDFDVVCDAVNQSAIHKFVAKPWSRDSLKTDIESAFQFYESQFD